MPVRIPFGQRVFAPNPVLTVLTAVACLAFLSLGRWQWHKGQLRQAEWDEFARGAGEVMALGALPVTGVPRFQRVRLTGRYDEAHQFLLDNRTYAGRAGYEVLTPLERSDGRVVLVDRGWVPFTGSRARLPGVALMTQDSATITGRVDALPSAGLQSGRAPPAATDRWPKVTSYPTIDQLSAALGRPVEEQIVLLDPGERDGYVRDWHPPGMEPVRHWSYAVQWWSFAALAFILWAALSARKIQVNS